MKIPFTVEQFFSVFLDYNFAVWPAQVFSVALAVMALVLVVAPQGWSGVAVSSSLVSFLGPDGPGLPPRLFLLHQPAGLCLCRNLAGRRRYFFSGGALCVAGLNSHQVLVPAHPSDMANNPALAQAS